MRTSPAPARPDDRGGPGARPVTYRTGVLRSLLATAAAGAVTVALAAGAQATVAHGRTSVDQLVGGAVLALGAAAGALLTIGALLLLVTATGRAAGRSWRMLDAVTTAVTPALLRRAVAVTVGAGLGLMGTTAAAVGAEVDLGWAITTTDSAPGTQGSPAAASTTSPPGGTPAGGDESPDSWSVRAQAKGPVVLDAGDQRAETAVSGASVAPELPGAPEDAPGLATTTSPEVAAAQDTAASPGAAAPPDAADGPEVAIAPEAALGPEITIAPEVVEPPDGGGAGPGAPAQGTGRVVAAGDTLWSIAAEHLGPGCDEAAIAGAWPRWYERNHDVIGEDPDLIRPGLVLHPPAPTDEPGPAGDRVTAGQE